MKNNAATATLPASYDQLANDIINLYASIQAASYQLLKLIHAFDEAELAQANGFVSTVQWLGYYLGVGPNAAREKIRVARALTNLPRIDAAYAAGQLSFSKVRALTRATHADNEAVMLDAALNATAHQVERIVRDQLRIQRGRPSVDRQPELTWTKADNGEIVFKGRLPKESGQLVIKAIERILDDQAALDAAQPEAEPLATRRAQALVEIAEVSLAPRPDKPQASADRYTVHIEHDDPDLSAAAVERLTCDGALVIHQTDRDGNPLDVGRKTRTIPPAIRRALQRRDKGCRFPGCNHKRFVDAHHVHHWAHGGETKLDNLVLLCRRHHSLIHDGGTHVSAHKPERGAVQFHFHTSDGERMLPTGDGCLAKAEISDLPHRKVADVTAVTSEGQSPFAPIELSALPNYDEIAWVLGQWGPPDT